MISRRRSFQENEKNKIKCPEAELILLRIQECQCDSTENSERNEIINIRRSLMDMSVCLSVCLSVIFFFFWNEGRQKSQRLYLIVKTLNFYKSKIGNIFMALVKIIPDGEAKQKPSSKEMQCISNII